MSRTSISKSAYPIIADPGLFAQYTGGLQLRSYQLPAVRAIVDSVFAHRGDTIVIEFSRQSGKDESLAIVIAYLLRILHAEPATIVYASPTFRPQIMHAMQRLEDRLTRNLLTLGRWKKRAGYIFQLGKASVSYLSAEPSANVVGATASHLLIINEAQDVLPAIYDKRFAPMAAATNATRVFAGTAWAIDSLLERERLSALMAESRDGRPRVFLADADLVGRESGSYAAHVASEVHRLGRQHPLIKTQYYCETLDAVSGMFSQTILSIIPAQPGDRPSEPSPDRASGEDRASWGHESPRPARIARGSFERPSGTSETRVSDAGYSGDMNRRSSREEDDLNFRSDPIAFLIDVAGQSESSPDPLAYTSGGRDSTQQGERPASVGYSGDMNRRSDPIAFLIDVAGQSESSPDPLAYTPGGRDSTTLTVVSIEKPGASQSIPPDQSSTSMGPTYHVINRYSWTGSNHLHIFDQLKSLAATYNPAHIVIDASGVGEGLWAMLDRAFPRLVIPVKFTSSRKSDIGWRFLAITGTGRFRDHCHTPLVHAQYLYCRSEILPGPEKLIRWGVPDGFRAPSGELVHDDHLLADSLVAELDLLPWSVPTPTLIIPAPDPLDDMERAF